MNETTQIIRKLDKLIFSFTVLFLLTLTNSIFLNQIGYYGALLFILIRFAFTKKNPFPKTGLEIPFLFFIIAEIISTVFSVNHSQAFRNLLKRFLLIPVVYTMIVAAGDYKKAVLFVKIFLGAALITILAYIAFAYEHFIQQLYRIESKGPSPFQYVMTAGGLISFVAVYYFAFFLEYKNKLKFKVLFLTGFLITILALLASYTRAAWLGTIAGIGIMLLLKRKYVLLSAIAAILLLAIVLIPNESKIRFYSNGKDNPELVKVLDTQGRAYEVTLKNNIAYVADYENGILIVDGSFDTAKVQTPFPVTSVTFWGEKLFAKLVDGRFVLWNAVNDKEFQFDTEFVSPGDTKSFAIKNNLLYVNDLDSGLTVYLNNQNINERKRFPAIHDARNISVSKSHLALYNLNEKNIEIYSLDSLHLPSGLNGKIHLEKNYVNLWIWNNRLFADNEDGLYVFNLKDISRAPEIIKEIRGVISIKKRDNDAVILSAVGKIHFVAGDDEGNLREVGSYNLKFKPSSFAINGERLAVTSYKRNRLLSVVDLYHTTNIQRIIQWETGLKILRDHPLFGVGDIDMQKLFSMYKPYYMKENFGHLHNNYVHILVILGVFGFVVFIILLAKIFKTDFTIYKKSISGTFQAAFALGTIGMFTAFLVSGLAEWNFGDHEIITMVWFSLGLNIALHKTSESIGKSS